MYLKLKGFQGFKLSNCLLFEDFHLFKENKWFLKVFFYTFFIKSRPYMFNI